MEREFDIALSFAGEDRDYVEQVANLLRDSGVKVFYDLFEDANLWGKNLYDYLSEIYMNKAAYTIMFISKYYAQKLWCSHERQAMQARAFQEHQEYILPARFDETPIPGVPPTVVYMPLAGRELRDPLIFIACSSQFATRLFGTVVETKNSRLCENFVYRFGSSCVVAPGGGKRITY